MRSLILALALTLPCLALANEDDPFGDDEDYDAPKAKPKPKPQPPAPPEKKPEPKPQPAAEPPKKPEPKAEPRPEPKTEPLAREEKPAPVARPSKPADAPRRVQTQPGVPAGPVAVLVVPLDPASAAGALAFERQLAGAFAAEGRLVAADIDGKLGSPAAPTSPPEVQAHLDAGRQAFDNLDLDAAANEYNAAIKLLLGKPEAVVPTQVAHAYTLSGAAYSLNGDEKRAQAAYKQAAVIAPEWSPPATDFSPDIIAAFEEAKKTVVAGAKGSLSITANVSPAMVYVGGRQVGYAPVKLEGLPPGRHHVMVRSRAHNPWVAFVELTAKGPAEATADAALEPLPTAAPLARGQQAAWGEAAAGRAGAGAAELGQLFGASYLVLGQARPDPASGTLVEYHAIELPTGRIAGSGQRAVTPGTPAFEADLKALAPQLSSAFLDPILVAEEPKISTPLKERWWFWPAVGGVAAVAVGAVVYGIVAATGDSGPPSLVTTGIP